ncbi:Histidine kinase domain-containing protein, double CACHE domain-containing [Desulfonema limicola]|uniref:histidine kinase n=1 Tax=Desulfonema limicola TaxID=45656 RepID=A0A975BCN0_9BACT|nr:PAS domain-containing sensor histidine kinase [Desulfonema limicola]QTA83032.1 Histidine kinase domain-containing protein, double CACHE domain-containing [Desulfonema limicola]
MKEQYYKSIRKNVLMSMILIPVIPFILSLGTGYYSFTSSLENSTISSMKRIMEDHSQMIDSFLAERMNDLEFILNTYSYEQVSSPDTLSGIFKNLQAGSEAFVDIGVFNDSGSHVAYHGPYSLKWKVYREEDWFIKVMKKGYYISDIFLGYRQVPHFIIAVKKHKGSSSWILRATIDTQMFTDIVEKVRIGKTGEAYLLNMEGILQTNLRSGKKLMEKTTDPVRYPDSENEIKTFIDKDINGEEYLFATAWLKDKEWVLVIRQEKADAFKTLSFVFNLIVFISMTGFILIICSAFYITERIINHMKQMDFEKEELGQHLIRAQRLAELGEMAAGFAHEINNPLQIIRSEQALIEMNLSEFKESGTLTPSESLSEIDDSMSQIKLQIDRCASITQAILKFGRQSEPKLQDVDLRSFIPQIIDMVAKKASVNGIDIIQDISLATPPVHGDPGHIQQVLLNLFNNAMDAIAEKHGSSGGRLYVESGPKDNKYTEIIVKDNGCGISPENLKKIFSPFFTTKPVGKGTGLGLSVCHGIIDNMGGVMQADSEPGKGTIFSINLPVSRK